MPEIVEYVGRMELENVDRRLSKEIKENRDHIDEHSKSISRLEAVYSSLEYLPITITNLEKTMAVIGNNLETMDRNIADVKKSVEQQEQTIKNIKDENARQNANIEAIDDKSKIDIMLVIKNNFWKILSILAVGYALIDTIMKKGG